ncbi:hypothetical protein IFM89_008262 [Coptis chinensis]|uniref:Uncharacterized protein n=1 Tax=Coptis chinensis TaxID=261450 RepID=A0A835M1Z1_9MAGN|nr:hypothetical protein IFM89_008262 [Coptis chinensis]
MGSSHFGELILGNGKPGSSKKGKKKSDKPKQPQRGLGVAQLEKIRLHNQMSSGLLPAVHAPYATHHINQEQDSRASAAYSSLIASSSFSHPSLPPTGFGFPPNVMMGMGEMEPRDMRYADPQSSTPTRWNYNNGIIENQYPNQPDMNKPIFSLQMEHDSAQNKRRKARGDSMGSCSQNSDSSETQEIDLELRL